MLLDLLPVVIEGTGGGNTYDKTGTAAVIPSGSASYYTEKLGRRWAVASPERRIAKTGTAEMFPDGSGAVDRALLSLMRQLFEEDELVSLDLL